MQAPAPKFLPAIEIIEAPSNLGLLAASPEHEPGVNQLPSWLQQHGLYSLIKPAGITHTFPPPYGRTLDTVSGVLNADALVAYSQQLSLAVAAALSRHHFPLVLGGDCSILIGSALALSYLGRYGLFYMDGHTDFVLLQQSVTKAAAGMDLALVTGNGPDKLTKIAGQKPYIEEAHVFAFGNRYFKDDYVAAIRQTAIGYAALPDIRRQGIDSICQKFLQLIEAQQLDGFWIHLDVDVLDDFLMPAVDSRQAGGLSYAELWPTLTQLLAFRKAVGLQITILDPELDQDGRYTRQFIQRLAPVLRAGSG